MKYINILSDSNHLKLKLISDDLYDEICFFVNSLSVYSEWKHPNFQILYDNLCEDEPDEVGVALWNKLNEREDVDFELIEEY